MTVRQMHHFPDPILRAKTVRVKDVAAPTIQRLIDDMIESMYYYHGVGIAANQVGSRYRICIIQRPEDEEPLVFINLELLRVEGERETTEGCLSLPGYQGEITRSEKVWAKALDRHGKPVRIRGATDLLAQALEHESGHLDGKAYTDYLKNPEDLYPIEPAPHGEEEDSSWPASTETD